MILSDLITPDDLKAAITKTTGKSIEQAQEVAKVETMDVQEFWPAAKLIHLSLPEGAGLAAMTGFVWALGKVNAVLKTKHSHSIVVDPALWECRGFDTLEALLVEYDNLRRAK